MTALLLPLARALTRSRSLRTVISAGVVTLSACGGGGAKDAGPTSPPPTVDLTKPTAISVASGSGQTVRIRSAVPSPVSFRVTNVNGTGLASVSVSLAVTGGGGTLATSTAVSAADGTVTLPAWTMGTLAGQNTVSATVNSSVSTTVSVTARNPLWTVMVYLAADNSLAAAGISDLDEMESYGSSDEVQVVVQAEFSPATLGQYGITSASTLRLPTWNTVRYAVPVGAAATNPFGPNGTATDVGNRDMTSATELRGFVSWAAQQAPAEHYALVLWNHGSGAFGLIADETSNPSAVMSLSQLRAALSGGMKLDVTVFDMCLMGTIETVAALRGLSATAVFSQEVVPGQGYDYRELLKVFNQQPTASATTLAANLVDGFFLGYATDLRESLTMSAVAIDAADPLLTAWDALGTTLQGMASTSVPTVATGVMRSQPFEFLAEKDLWDVLDSVRVRLADTPTRSAIDAVKAQLASSSVLLRARQRIGTGPSAKRVGRAKGLSVVWPSGSLTDAMSSSGPQSLASYATNAGSTTWPTFLSRYLTTAQYAQVVDLGTNPVSWFIVWSQAHMTNGADIDLVIFEPTADGSGWNLYSPSLGTVTPNGGLSPDSYESGFPVEGWVSNRFIQRGIFYLGALLYSDPNNLQPTLNVYWRRGFTADFTALYAANALPRLTLVTRFANDPSPTMTKLLNNAYTDLRIVSTWDFRNSAAASVAEMRADGTFPMSALAEPVFPSTTVPVDAPAVTLSPPQVAAIRALRTARMQGLRDPAVVNARVRDALRAARRILPSVEPQ